MSTGEFDGLLEAVPAQDGPVHSTLRALLAGIDGAPRSPRLEHLRVKPGRSLTARVVGEPGDAPWWATIRTPAHAVKVANLLDRAAETGIPLAHAPLPHAQELHLLAGPPGLDGRLRRPLARAGVVTARGAVRGTVLSFNPWRRLVLRRNDSDTDSPAASVLRIWATAPPSAGLVEPLQRAGAPVLPSTLLPGDVLAQPWVDGGDLDTLLETGDHTTAGAPHPAIDRLGAAIAGLHSAGRRLTAEERDRLPAVDPHTALAAARDGAAALLPRLLPEFDRAAPRVLAALAADRTPQVILHGDLSADQAVRDARGTVRLIDLDRMAVGSAGHDLGGFAATEWIRGRATAEQFLTAYRAEPEAVPVADPLVRAWAAHHLLLRAAEPARMLDPQAVQRSRERIDRARALVDGKEEGLDG